MDLRRYTQFRDAGSLYTPSAQTQGGAVSGDDAIGDTPLYLDRQTVIYFVLCLSFFNKIKDR